jgi:hypothetical protein
MDFDVQSLIIKKGNELRAPLRLFSPWPFRPKKRYCRCLRPSVTLGTSAFKMIRLRQLWMDFDVLWLKWKKNTIRRAVCWIFFRFFSHFFLKSSFEFSKFSKSCSSLSIWGSAFKMPRLRQLCMDFDVYGLNEIETPYAELYVGFLRNYFSVFQNRSLKSAIF